MNRAELDTLVTETFDSLRNLLVTKGGEYAGSEDVLANFKRGGELTGVRALTCLFIYLSKHYDAVATYTRDMQQGKDRPRSESIEGRLDDLMNYCMLAKALIREESGKGVLPVPRQVEKGDVTLELLTEHKHSIMLEGGAAMAVLPELEKIAGSQIAGYSYLGSEICYYSVNGQPWSKV